MHTHQAFLPAKKITGQSAAAARPQEPLPSASGSNSLRESLIVKGQDHSSSSHSHSHHEIDAEASFVIWEHEKEALQSRLTKRREGLFRCSLTHARAIASSAGCPLNGWLLSPLLSHAHIRGASGSVTLTSLAGFLRDVATEAFSAAVSLIKNLPSTLVHLVIGQESRVFCVETVRFV
jgi:hypothetical protein